MWCLREYSIRFIDATIRIVPSPNFEEIVLVRLECDSQSAEVYKEFLSINEETHKKIIIPLSRQLIGESLGTCKINVYAGNKSEAVSQSFRISNVIKVNLMNLEEGFNPGNTISIQGSAIKENGGNVDGYYEANINGTFLTGEVSEGNFEIPFYIEKSFPAGQYMIDSAVYEKDILGEIINSGKKIYFLKVKQVPTNVEVLLENMSILPGEAIKGKVVLHDQTGESIPNAEVYIAIKDSLEIILEKIVTKTETEFEYGIKNSEPPSIFHISVYSEGIVQNAEINILEKKEIKTEIVNNTLILTNVGNVFYNDTLVVKIGEDNVSILLSLGVGEGEKYLISAPDGSYDVSVGGMKKTLLLSGNAVGVKELNGLGSGVSLVTWIILIVFLFIGAYFTFMKIRKKRSFAKSKKVSDFLKIKPKVYKNAGNPSINTKDENNNLSARGGAGFFAGKKVELSLSIAGSKQNASIGCISLKNYAEIASGEGNVKETLEKISSIIEDKKGFIYSNASYLFFIFAPSFTRTFKNQKDVVLVSQEIKEMLKLHNKKFRKKINFGISLNYGGIIIKNEAGIIKFMSLGTLMTSAKKLANYSDSELIISDSFKENFDENLKGDVVNIGGVKAYKLEGLVDKNKHSTFIKGFLARQERDRAKEVQKAAEAKEKKIVEEDEE